MKNWKDHTLYGIIIMFGAGFGSAWFIYSEIILPTKLLDSSPETQIELINSEQQNTIIQEKLNSALISNEKINNQLARKDKKIDSMKIELKKLENKYEHYKIQSESSNSVSQHTSIKAKSSTDSPSNHKVVLSKTKWSGLEFTIIEAIQESNNLTIKFSISNPSSDKKIGMLNGGDAKIFIKGEEYRHSFMQIGKSSGYALYQGVTIPGGISVNSLVKFKSIPSDISKIDMFRVLFWDEKISFNNIRIN